MGCFPFDTHMQYVLSPSVHSLFRHLLDNKYRTNLTTRVYLWRGRPHNRGPSAARDVGLDATVEDVSYSIEDVHFPHFQVLSQFVPVAEITNQLLPEIIIISAITE